VVKVGRAKDRSHWNGGVRTEGRREGVGEGTVGALVARRELEVVVALLERRTTFSQLGSVFLKVRGNVLSCETGDSHFRENGRRNCLVTQLGESFQKDLVQFLCPLHSLLLSRVGGT